jgi:hypothetical protein
LTGLTKLWYIILMFLYYTSKRLSSDCWWVFEGRIGCGALPAPSLRSLRSLRSGTGHAFCRWVVALFRGVSGLIVSPLIDIMRSHRTCNACAMPGKKNPVMSHAIVVHPIDAELCQLSSAVCLWPAFQFPSRETVPGRSPLFVHQMTGNQMIRFSGF